MTTDNEYLFSMIKSWENKKNSIRKELPRIYQEANEDIKTIIAMLVESEYEIAINLDNIIRKNTNGKTDKDVNAENYKKENKIIIEMLGM